MIPRLAVEIVNNMIANLLRTVGLSRLVAIAAIILPIFRYDPLTREGFVKDTKTIFAEYDFIVIGGGSAGCVIANRLSEMRNWNVLLLEAGGNEQEFTEVPSLFIYMLGTSIDWKYQTEPPQKGHHAQYCLAMNDNRCNWARGKILGGTSAINAMLYIRGNKNDFDNWAHLGNTGWSYEQVLPYFLKSEDNLDKKYLKTRYHKKGGYLTVNEAPFKTPLVDVYIEAGREMGYKIHDVNGASQEGLMVSQATLRTGKRCSTARAFLRPVRNRKNLHISLNSHVTKILIEPSTKTAYGVEFTKNGVKYRTRARKEVILSAGAIASPQLLMLSGVGIREHLEEHDIPLIQDLRVGDNLQDHYGLGGMTFTVDPPISVQLERILNVNNVVDYIAKQNGPTTGITGECVAFLKTKYANKSIDWPDIQFDYAPFSMNADPELIKRMTNIRDGDYEQVYSSLGKRDAFLLIPNIMRPKSRGSIRLKNSDAHAHPAIYPNFFDNDDDTRVLIDGVRLALKYAQQSSFRRINAKHHIAAFSGCGNFAYDTDKYWECTLKHFTFTLWHYVGTCKMGPDDDPSAVVDPKLRVRGIRNLRVADASVMPVITTGNINAVVIMIGEKVSDMIKEDWGRSN